MTAPTRARANAAQPPAPPVQDRATAYARSVVAGEVLTGKAVRQTCQRHLDDLDTAAARGLVWDVAAAETACDFFPLLPHIKGEWATGPASSFKLQPWQCFIVGSVFGWRRAATGLRRFRTAYVELARKNGKSTLAAGLGIRLAFFDGEPGAEVYCAATKRDQAKIVWGDARQMVLKTPGLRARITPLVGNLHSTASGSKFEPLGADGDSMDGLNIHAAIVDELHAHKTRTIVDVLETGTGARRQPLLFYITTAGHDRLSVCWEHHDYSLRLLDGLVQDDTWFSYVAAIDEGDAWDNPDVWPKANPNLGVSVKIDDLMIKRQRAREVPGEQNAFRRLHCNEWTEQDRRWIDMDRYDANDAHPIVREEYAGRQCWAGLDLSRRNDLTAGALLFRCPHDPLAVDAVLRFWIPADAIRRRSERDRVPYDVWDREGLIRATEGNVVDYRILKADIIADAIRHEIVDFGYDPYNATHLIQELQDEDVNAVEIRQGYLTLSPPTKELETLILAGRFHHGGNPVLRWMFGNVVLAQDPAGNIKVDKERSRERIDGVAAIISGLARMILAPDDSAGESWYARNEVLFV